MAMKSTFSVPQLLRRLRDTYPDAHCELHFQSPLQLLIATILSAQCTDVRVNEVTQNLFQKYFSPQDYLDVPLEQLENDIRSTGFYRNKARNIRGACRTMIEEFDGEVPRQMDQLLRLPGVARKTANVVLGNAFHRPCGFVVDTHVKRVSFRLGLTDNTDPVKIERDLMAAIPPDAWLFAGHAIIWHGRRVCFARNPHCSECVLKDICPKRGVTSKK